MATKYSLTPTREHNDDYLQKIYAMCSQDHVEINISTIERAGYNIISFPDIFEYRKGVPATTFPYIRFYESDEKLSWSFFVMDETTSFSIDVDTEDVATFMKKLEPSYASELTTVQKALFAKVTRRTYEECKALFVLGGAERFCAYAHIPYIEGFSSSRYFQKQYVGNGIDTLSDEEVLTGRKQNQAILSEYIHSYRS